PHAPRTLGAPHELVDLESDTPLDHVAPDPASNTSSVPQHPSQVVDASATADGAPSSLDSTSPDPLGRSPGLLHRPERPSGPRSPARRRRRRPSRGSSAESPSTSSEGRAKGQQPAVESTSPRQRRAPRRPRKRRRVGSIMRLEDRSSSAYATPGIPHSNTSSRSPRRKAPPSHPGSSRARSLASQNGSSPVYRNGSTNGSANGVAARPTPPDYFGHDREEVIRILIQTLHDLGCRSAAGALSRESGYDLESPTIAAFRHAVLQGEWAEAEALLSGGPRAEVDDASARPSPRSEIVLAEGADPKEMLFSIRQQKYLELLEQRDLGTALMVLRQELTPLHQDIARLHALSRWVGCIHNPSDILPFLPRVVVNDVYKSSADPRVNSLMMCQSAEDLQSQADWDGAGGSSRHDLLSELSKSISPSVMIPERRLAMLLHQVKQTQIAPCLYHNTTASPSLYCDHRCDRSQFPLQTSLELDHHRDEIWTLKFSHDGTRLATGSRDRTIIVYDVPSFDIVQQLTDHEDGIVHLVWSPDDTKILTCTHGGPAVLWDVVTGKQMLSLPNHGHQFTAGAWAPDGQSFITGSTDRLMQLCQWNLAGTRLHAWSGHFRVRDCSISPDGRRLVAVSQERRIHVYDFRTRAEEYSVAVKVELTCVSISQDSRYMLVNTVQNEIQLLDLETAELLRRFSGQQQGTCIIRSAFGGAHENFVVSGSENNRIYIWHREHEQPLETLEGHRGGCVNSVAWHPHNPGMFASAGDDMRVRIWTPAQTRRKQGDSTNGYHL
ncbi:MAG: hypothetical protein M1823_001218, partial [Watsoniomyces obsoletus]